MTIDKHLSIEPHERNAGQHIRTGMMCKRRMTWLLGSSEQLQPWQRVESSRNSISQETRRRNVTRHKGCGTHMIVALGQMRNQLSLKLIIEMEQARRENITTRWQDLFRVLSVTAQQLCAIHSRSGMLHMMMSLLSSDIPEDSASKQNALTTVGISHREHVKNRRREYVKEKCAEAYFWESRNLHSSNEISKLDREDIEEWHKTTVLKLRAAALLEESTGQPPPRKSCTPPIWCECTQKISVKGVGTNAEIREGGCFRIRHCGFVLGCVRLQERKTIEEDIMILFLVKWDHRTGQVLMETVWAYF